MILIMIMIILFPRRTTIQPKIMSTIKSKSMSKNCRVQRHAQFLRNHFRFWTGFFVQGLGKFLKA
jgi:hypothetical protein